MTRTIKSINSERIEWCCADRGISPEHLASELGFSWTRFQKNLEKRSGLTYNQLRKLSRYFNRGVLFFLEPGKVVASEIYSPQFRSLANQKPSLSPKLQSIIKRAELHRDIYLTLREELEDTELPLYSPPHMNGSSPIRAAEKARDWLKVSDENDFATYRSAIEAKGILVFRSNGYNGPWQIPKDETIWGFTIYSEDCPVIVVKKLPYKSRQVFTLIHELGHLLLHKESFIDEEDDFWSYIGKEKAANSFAGHLLVPDGFLREINDKAKPSEVSEYDNWLSQQCHKWGVSPEVVLRRLLDSKRLSEEEYNAYRVWRMKQEIPSSRGGARKYRYREPRHIFGDRYVSTVLDALHSRKIPLSKASTYLDNLKISDVHKLEAAYAHA